MVGLGFFVHRGTRAALGAVLALALFGAGCASTARLVDRQRYREACRRSSPEKDPAFGRAMARHAQPQVTVRVLDAAALEKMLGALPRHFHRQAAVVRVTMRVGRLRPNRRDPTQSKVAVTFQLPGSWQAKPTNPVDIAAWSGMPRRVVKAAARKYGGDGRDGIAAGVGTLLDAMLSAITGGIFHSKKKSKKSKKNLGGIGGFLRRAGRALGGLGKVVLEGLGQLFSRFGSNPFGLGSPPADERDEPPRSAGSKRGLPHDSPALIKKLVALTRTSCSGDLAPGASCTVHRIIPRRGKLPDPTFSVFWTFPGKDYCLSWQTVRRRWGTRGDAVARLRGLTARGPVRWDDR